MARQTADLGHHLHQGLHILHDGALQLHTDQKQSPITIGKIQSTEFSLSLAAKSHLSFKPPLVPCLVILNNDLLPQKHGTVLLK